MKHSTLHTIIIVTALITAIIHLVALIDESSKRCTIGEWQSENSN